MRPTVPGSARRLMGQAGVMAMGAFLGLFLGWLAIREMDWGRVRELLDQFPLPMVALVAVLLLLSGYLRAWRWRLLWTTQRVSALRLFWIENAALGLNNISPVRALDEPVEFGILTLRDRLPGGATMATMVISRIQDVAFTILYVAMAIATMPGLLRFTPAIALTGLYFVTWLLILLNLGRLVRRFPMLGRIPGLGSFEGALAALRVRKGRLAAAFAITCLYWLLLGPAGWLIAWGTGIELGLHQVLFVVLGSIFFSTALPALPSALGTFEFAVVSLLGLWDVPKEHALSFAVILHTVLFVPPTLIAVLVLPREGAASVSGLRKLMRGWDAARRGKA